MGQVGGQGQVGKKREAAQEQGPAKKRPYVAAPLSHLSQEGITMEMVKQNAQQDWRQRLDCAMVAPASAPDTSARHPDSPSCDVCSVEKWDRAHFCWNEKCPVSPVYFRLACMVGGGQGWLEATEVEGEVEAEGEVEEEAEVEVEAEVAMEADSDGEVTETAVCATSILSSPSVSAPPAPTTAPVPASRELPTPYPETIVLGGVVYRREGPSYPAIDYLELPAMLGARMATQAGGAGAGGASKAHRPRTRSPPLEDSLNALFLRHLHLPTLPRNYSESTLGETDSEQNSPPTLSHSGSLASLADAIAADSAEGAERVKEIWDGGDGDAEVETAEA
mmetsp:Transcript_7010/g.15573  ORF Transcript_7010/g.15573 Transcript_7010/m.15573 type:complete len:335 (-) Transcript_7010:133-1137(-)